MKIISSQQYVSEKILAEKMDELENETSITLPCWEVGDEIEDGDLAVLCDGHHRLAAARLLGIEVKFEAVKQPEDLSGQALLDCCWMDGDWYYVEESDALAGKIVTVW